MLSPHSLRLFLGTDGAFRCAVEESTQVDAYVRAMRVVQQRTGAAPRAALSNCAPLHVASLAGSLTIARVTGLPHHQDPARSPVALSPDEHAIFLKRGDHFLLRTDLDGERHEAFVALSYDIAPRLLVGLKPLVQRNPLDNMIADVNAARLLELVQERELSAVEQFVASQTMPGIWRRLGGSAVAAITRPTIEDANRCREFAENFSDPEGRLRSIAQFSSAWGTALHDSRLVSDRERVPFNDRPLTAESPLRAPAEAAGTAAPSVVAPAASVPRMRI